MRRLFIILILTYIATIAYSQQAPKPDDMRGNTNCVYRHKYSSKQRLNFYPFSKFETVKLVSFRYHLDDCPIKSESVVADSLIELKILTKPEIYKLTDVLYNNFFKRKPNYGTTSQCFWPRNAILFYDTVGNLKESILICFQCDRYSLSSNDIEYGDECDQKMDLLRSFFLTAGISFGTSNNSTFYPGERYKDEGLDK